MVEYPLATLGGILGAAARAIAEGAQIAPAIAGQYILAAAALAAQGVAEVASATGRKPLSLNLLTVALSGDGKSTADSPALAPIREVERTEYLCYEKDRAAWESAQKTGARQNPSTPCDSSRISPPKG